MHQDVLHLHSALNCTSCTSHLALMVLPVPCHHSIHQCSFVSDGAQQGHQGYKPHPRHQTVVNPPARDDQLVTCSIVIACVNSTSFNSWHLCFKISILVFHYAVIRTTQIIMRLFNQYWSTELQNNNKPHLC